MMIKKFEEIRRDGKLIPESMTLAQLIARGWPSDKVTIVRWQNNGLAVELIGQYGLLAKVLPDRSGVACIENLDEVGQNSTFYIRNADGSNRMTIQNTQVINGKPELGQYCWYEPARIAAATSFGVIFRIDRNQELFQIDMNSKSGEMEGVHHAR